MNNRKPKYTVAISGLNAIDNPGPGVAVARGLKEAAAFDVRIIGFSYESLEPGIYMHDLISNTLPHSWYRRAFGTNEVYSQDGAIRSNYSEL